MNTTAQGFSSLPARHLGGEVDLLPSLAATFHKENEMTEWEAKVIRYAAGGEHLGDTPRLWDTVADLQKRGLMVAVERGKATHIVPTPDALVDAIEFEALA